MNRREAAIARAYQVVEHIQPYLRESKTLSLEVVKDLQAALRGEAANFANVGNVNASDVHVVHGLLQEIAYKVRDMRWAKDATYTGRN